MPFFDEAVVTEPQVVGEDLWIDNEPVIGRVVPQPSPLEQSLQQGLAVRILEEQVPAGQQQLIDPSQQRIHIAYVLDHVKERDDAIAGSLRELGQVRHEIGIGQQFILLLAI